MENMIDKTILKIREQFEEPINPCEVAKSLGLTVDHVVFEKDSTPKAAIIRKDENHGMIQVSNLESRNIKRFIVAHELGHYLLNHKHHKYVEPEILKGLEATEKEEMEANAFAFELMLPKESMIQRFNQYKDKQLDKSSIITIISMEYNLPAYIVFLRLKQLNLL